MFNTDDKVMLKITVTDVYPYRCGVGVDWDKYNNQIGTVIKTDTSDGTTNVRFDNITWWVRTCDLHPVGGYHQTRITKGEFGSLSKVREELDEAEDAEKQGIKIMLACELADLFGALRAYAAKQGLTVSDLSTMADATERAFTSGERK